MNRPLSKYEQRLRRHRRVRRRIFGTAERPRLAVFRSLKHISAQLIDDTVGRTLVAVSDRQMKSGKSATVAVSKDVGRQLAERAKTLKIRRVVFDRAGHTYHGQVKALADGARAGGLEF